MPDPRVTIAVAAHQDNIFEPSRMMSESPVPQQYTNHTQNIRNIRNRAVIAHTDRKSVTAVAIVVAEDNIACWTVDRYAIVAVVDHVVLE
jgi:hypothetical protein